MRTCLHALVLVMTLLGAGSVAAQSLVVDESPTQGVKIPAGALAGDADATATVLNPAGLALMRSASLTYLHTEIDGHQRRGGRGDGVYLAFRPVLGRVNSGVALEFMRPPGSFCSAPGAQRLSFAVGVKLLPGLALGATWGHLFSATGHGVDGMNTFDVGLVLRPFAHLAAAYVLRDLNSPAMQVFDQPRRVWHVPRVHEFEVTLRPAGDDRLEVAAAVRVAGAHRADPRARASLRLTRGLYLEGEFEARRLALTEESQYPQTITRWDFRGAAGLRVDLDHLTAAVYALFGQAPAGAHSFHGASGWLRLSAERHGPLWPGPAQVRRIVLEGSGGSDRDFVEVMLELRQAEHDPSVKGVLLVQDDLAVGWGRAEEVRSAIGRLRAAGKRVFAWAPSLGMRTYYMLAPCERIWLGPSGDVRLTGIAQRLMFYKGTFDKLGVAADFVKIAEYKSAPEAYTREGSSPPAREMREAVLDDTYDRVVAAIARERRLPAADVKRLVDHGPYAAQEAKAARLVDDVKYRDEIEGLLGEVYGHRVRVRDTPTAARFARTWRPPRVAVIFVDGDIVEGKSRDLPILNRRIAGSESITAAIRQAREDSSTRAIVLRINSPGGSVVAADEIAREVVRTRGKKPILCSMGDLGASGGYYVAAPCERIFAPASTITGSIGIFTGKFDVHAFAQRLGVSVETYTRGAHADISSPFRVWSDEERNAIARILRLEYVRFLEYVAAGRKLDLGKVDAIARGRVWTGAQAKARGLIDDHGGFLEVLDVARRRAGLTPDEPADVVMLPRLKRSIVERIASLVGEGGGPRRARGPATPVDAAGVPLPAALRDALRAVPPALLYARPGQGLYRLEYEESSE
ncbi:MAG: signal peptide peptidase SppA [Deltaproteobacteria bacterium]|nr:signal peptide peptidase SppA [Deltaproteobacteria bacterium]